MGLAKQSTQDLYAFHIGTDYWPWGVQVQISYNNLHSTSSNNLRKHNSRTWGGTTMPIFVEMSERRWMRKMLVEAKSNAGSFGKAE